MEAYYRIADGLFIMLYANAFKVLTTNLIKKREREKQKNETWPLIQSFHFEKIFVYLHLNTLPEGNSPFCHQKKKCYLFKRIASGNLTKVELFY